MIIPYPINHLDTNRASVFVNEKLYKLSCSNQVCNWETLSKELQMPRHFFTAIALPDDFVECN